MSAPSSVQAAVEFFFDCNCPWSYLALGRLREGAIRTGAKIIYRPVLLAEIVGKGVSHSGTVQGELAAARRRYQQKDLQDWARFCGVELQHPDIGPIDTEWAQRGAVVAQQAGVLAAYLELLYRVRFAEGRDIGKLAEITAAAQSAGLSGEAFESALRAPETLVELRRNAASLLDHGGFGTPTMLVGADLYYGNDRMPLVEIALARAGGMRLVMPGEHGS